MGEFIRRAICGEQRKGSGQDQTRIGQGDEILSATSQQGDVSPGVRRKMLTMQLWL